MDGAIIPVTISSPLIVFACACPPSTVRPTWVFAGSVQAVADFNLFNSATLDRTVFSIHSAIINRSRLIPIPRIINEYQLYFRPAKWIEQISIGVYQYTGSFSDELLSELIAIRSTERIQESVLSDIRDIQADILSLI